MSITQVTFKTWICEELIFIQTLFLQCFPGIFQKPVNAYVRGMWGANGASDEQPRPVAMRRLPTPDFCSYGAQITFREGSY